MRIILAPKAHIRIDRPEMLPRAERHRVTIYDDIILIRVIADARRGLVVKQQPGNHRNFRRRNLFLRTAAAMRAKGKEMREVHQGRTTAVQRALDAFDRASLGRLPVSRTSFAAILKRAFDLNDRLLLADGLAAAAE